MAERRGRCRGEQSHGVNCNWIRGWPRAAKRGVHGTARHHSRRLRLGRSRKKEWMRIESSSKNFQLALTKASFAMVGIGTRYIVLFVTIRWAPAAARLSNVATRGHLLFIFQD